MRMRPLFPLLALAAVVGTGCGAVEPGAGTSASAEVAPKNALAFIAVDTDTTSEQWRSVQDLLERFPALVDKLQEEGLDVDELSPALGDEVVVVVLAAGGEEIDAVVLARPTSRAKFDSLLDRFGENEPRATREVEGWTAVAETEAGLDRFEEARAQGSLAESARFRQTMEDLPAEALVTAFVDLEQAAALEEELDSVFADMKPDTLGAALEAREDGVRLSGTLRTEGDELGTSTRPELLEGVPADAFLALWFDGSGLGERLERVLEDERAEGLERELGVTPAQVSSLLDGEVVVFARAGMPIPEVSVLLESSGTELKTMQTLLQRVAAGAPVQVDESGGVVHATFGGGGPAPADKLVDDDRFERALDAAGVPDETTGLLYLDFQGVAPLLAAFAGLGGENPEAEVLRMLEPLRSLVVYGTGEPGVARFVAFLEID